MRGFEIMLSVGVVFTMSVAAPAQESRWGSPDEKLVQEITGKEKMWADGNCSPQPALKDVIADDFQGTAPDGKRYGKKDAIETNVDSPDRECQFGTVKVRFFGDRVAIAYGDESSLRKGADGEFARRCLVWTDTWLNRGGKWQIVAAQDNAVPCK